MHQTFCNAFTETHLIEGRLEILDCEGEKRSTRLNRELYPYFFLSLNMTIISLLSHSNLCVVFFQPSIELSAKLGNTLYKFIYNFHYNVTCRDQSLASRENHYHHRHHYLYHYIIIFSRFFIKQKKNSFVPSLLSSIFLFNIFLPLFLCLRPSLKIQSCIICH